MCDATLLESIFAGQPFGYWQEKFQAVGIPCTPVNSIDQVVDAEQVRVRELIATVAHPRVGAMRLAGLPIKLDETPGAVTRPPPLLGEHTAEILGALRYSSQRIGELAEAGVVEIAAATSST